MEVLSPVKNLKGAEIAILSGTNAIYFSSKIFGARDKAKNDHSEVSKIVRYAKLHYVKSYVVLNTIIKNNELSLFFNEINFLHSIGVDAVILQDVALISVVRAMFDDLDVHCSTQMNIGNSHAANFVKGQGASRIILPRELSFKDLEYFTNLGIETEVFVHGALCTSYSGQCFISAIDKNLSGNRGKCAQFCRMPSTIFKNGSELKTNPYMLSLKDLNASELVHKLKNIGVTSIKIEGRLKQLEYVGLVTNIYRSVVDNKLCDLKTLNKVYNREFTQGFLNSDKCIHNDLRINNNGYYVGKVIKQDSSFVYIKAVSKIVHQDKIRFIGDSFETGQSVDSIEKVNCDTFKIKCKLKNLTNTSVYVVNSYDVKSQLKNGVYSYYVKPKYSISIKLEVGKKVKVKCGNKTYYSNDIYEEAKLHPVDKETIIKQFNKTNDYPFDFKITIDYVSGFIRIGSINKLRRSIYESITADILKVNHSDVDYKRLLKNEFCTSPELYVEISNEEQLKSLSKTKRDFIVVISDDKLLKKAKQLFKKVFRMFSSVLNDIDITKYDYHMYDGVVVGEVGMLELLKDFDKPIITNYTLNTTNYINQQMYLKYASRTILSIENNYASLNDFNLKYAVGFLYGSVDVMQMKYCPINKDKVHSCNGCNLCVNNKYEVIIDNKKYLLQKGEFDKIKLLSSSPIYNKKLLDFKMNYYIRFTRESNVELIIEDIFNGNIENAIDMYGRNYD